MEEIIMTKFKRNILMAIIAISAGLFAFAPDVVLANDTFEIDFDANDMQVSVFVGNQLIANPDFSAIPAGSRLEITAQPAANYRVRQWIIDTDPQPGPPRLTLTIPNVQGDLLVEVEFEQIPTTTPHVVDIEYYPAGSGDVDVFFEAVADGTFSGTAPDGSFLQLEALPNLGYEFVEWQIDVGGTTEYITEASHLFGPINAAATITAIFEESHTVTFSANAGGNLTARIISVTPNVDIQSPHYVGNGHQVRFTAAPNTGFAVSHWIIDGSRYSANDGQITLDRYIVDDITVQVVFESTAAADTRVINFRVRAGYEALGSISATVANGASVALGVPITFTATPNNPNHRFRWYLNGNEQTGSVTNTVSLTMNALSPDVNTIEVAFVAVPASDLRVINHTVRTGDAARGTISATENDGAQVAVGRTVTFTAVPTAGSRVLHWLVNGTVQTSTANTFTYTVTAASFNPTNITVAFEAIPPTATSYTLTVNGNHAGITGTSTRAVGASITVEAGNRTGFVFSHWTTNGINFANPNNAVQTFTMPANNVTLTANWTDIRDLGTDFYWVNIINSWSSNSGSGARRADSTVNIQAGTRPGHTFMGWRSWDVSVSNQFAVGTSFIMPHHHVTIEAMWMPNDWDGGWHPDWGWDWNWGWGWDNNWQLQRPSGGVTFSYTGVNFPASSVVNPGASAGFTVRVDRLTNRGGATFTGQWLRDGVPHGGSFGIGIGAAGSTNVALNFTSFTEAHTGSYTLRVTTFVGGNPVYVDVSRPMVLSVQTTALTITPQTPQSQIPRDPVPPPPIIPAPVSFRPAIAATPQTNHGEVLRLMGESGAGQPIVLSMHGTTRLHLHGQTLDTLIAANRPLFVANGPMWAALPVDFLRDLRARGGNLIGDNGGTFDINIEIFYQGGGISGGNINFATTIGGNTRAISGFTAQYTTVIELGTDGQAGNFAALRAGQNLGATINRGTGVLSFNTATTGEFSVARVMN